MSKIKTVNTLEVLPNEILFECFKYLNGILIFHSFDQLNYRFNNLIRNIPLYLDFRNVYTLLFDQFCKKMLSDDEMKEQVYSLYLSNTDINNTIGQFLSYFSLDEFPHLRSLILAKIMRNNVPVLEQMLPLCSQLFCFRLINTTDAAGELVSVLPTSQLRILKVPRLSFSDEFSSITNLTVTGYSSDELCELFKNASNLKYLKLKHVPKNSLYWFSKKDNSSHHAIYLKHLVLTKFEGTLKDLTIILKQTPNLTNFTIDTSNNIDACQWEALITSCVPFLKIFKFNISYSSDDEMKEKFEEFQSEFWCQQHHWYTECIISEHSSMIYTIPFMFDTYTLSPNTRRYCNEFVDKSKTFDNIKSLIIDADIITEDECRFYFSSVTSLTLRDMFQYAERLTMLFNLFNLKHVVIQECYTYKTGSELLKLLEEISFVLLKLLKEAPQISSLDTHSNVLILSFNNIVLCKYLNKMITKLNIIDRTNNSMDSLCNLNQFCKTFSNLEELSCNLDQQDSLLFLLKHLPKLSRITTFSIRFTYYSIHSLIKEGHIGGRNISDFYHDESKHLSIWFN